MAARRTCTPQESHQASASSHLPVDHRVWLQGRLVEELECKGCCQVPRSTSFHSDVSCAWPASKNGGRCIKTSLACYTSKVKRLRFQYEGLVLRSERLRKGS